MNIDLFDGFFEKHSNIKFHENPSSESQTVGQTDRQTGRHYEADSYLRICANVPKRTVCK